MSSTTTNPTPKIRKPTILITGTTANSLGAALAHEFVRKGFHVFGTARSLASFSEEFQSNPSLTPIVLDVTSSTSIASAVEAISSQTDGTLDILFNNAGQSFQLPLADTPIERYKRLFDVNVFGVIEVTRAFLPLLVNAARLHCSASASGSSSSGRGPMVINQGSIASELPLVWSTAYASSKAALAKISDILRLELWPLGIQVKYLATGAVKSNIYKVAPNHSLPGNSLYGSVRESVDKVIRHEGVFDRAGDADVYAREVVDGILGSGRATGWFSNYATWQWAGKLSTVAWVLTRIMPGFVVRKFMYQSAGLGGLGFGGLVSVEQEKK